MVTPRRFARGSFRRSRAAAATSAAWLESSPPERPSTSLSTPTFFMRVASALLWISNTSQQRWASVAGSRGTKGCASTARRSAPPGLSFAENGTRRKGFAAVAAAVAEGRRRQPLVDEELEVHVAGDELRVAPEALARGQLAPVLDHEGVGVEGQVGRRLAGAGGHVDVGALAPVGRGLREEPPQLRLADGEVRGGEVRAHRRAGRDLRHVGGRWTQ
jgi:hypothetical protein